MKFTNNRCKINNVDSPWKPQVIASGNPKEERSNVIGVFTDHEIRFKKINTKQTVHQHMDTEKLWSSAALPYLSGSNATNSRRDIQAGQAEAAAASAGDDEERPPTMHS